MKFRKKNYHSSARLHGFIRDTRYAIRYERGFTLVELIVSIGLFSIVMLVSVGALLALTGANRKAQALQSVMNNLNIALDGMVRSIRMGSYYHCDTNTPSDISVAKDCAIDGGSLIAFKPFCDENCDQSNRWVYYYDVSDKRIYKSEQGGANPVALTSSEITMDNMRFYVAGTATGNSGDTEQPKVVITLTGTADATNAKTKTTFNIQATAVQRQLDL